jgi:hypothetical protein
LDSNKIDRWINFAELVLMVEQANIWWMSRFGECLAE